MEQIKLFFERLFHCIFALLLILCVFTALSGVGAYEYVNSVFAVRLSDSGQTTCYNNTAAMTSCPVPGNPFYGQDGSYLIDPPSYTKLDAAGDPLLVSATSWVAVKDNVTGLVWEIKTAGNKADTFTLTGAEAYASELTLAGRSDWRLPTLKELESIVDLRNSLPTVYTAYFNNTYSSATNPAFYWSSDQYTAFPSATPPFPYQWGVDFNYGYDDYYFKTGNYYVRAVSAQTAYPTYPSLTTYSSASTLVGNNNGTVTDTSTGLMWQQATAIPMIWETAVSYCQGLSLAHYSDWRLPSLKELHSIVDYTCHSPAINTSFFPNTENFGYWSSTTGIKYNDYNYAYYLDFTNGSDRSDPKSSYSYHVRAVRCGQPRISGNLFISEPVRASVWQVGDYIGIEWEPQGITGDVIISISRSGGMSGTFIGIDRAENDGYYNWIVTEPPSVNCVLKIEPVNAPSNGTTQGLFMIKSSPKFPVVTTAPVSTITGISASGGGDVTSSGGDPVTDRGICWATFADPTISNCNPPSPTHDGFGTGSFTSAITGLISGTTYHVRAYATNSTGTGYGNDVSFTTQNTLYVRSINNDCGGKTPCYDSIQEAMDNATAGSIILIARGDYTPAGSVTLNPPSRTLTLQGGWDASFSIGSLSNTTFIRPPHVPQGTLVFQMVTIR